LYVAALTKNITKNKTKDMNMLNIVYSSYLPQNINLKVLTTESPVIKENTQKNNIQSVTEHNIKQDKTISIILT
jgi:hypothetical protein